MTASEQPAEPTPQVVSRWLGVVGLFIAPTTVITALCLYFGYVSTRASLAYFGVDSDAVGYTTSDYVLKSVSVLYPQIVALLLGWGALLWVAVFARRLAARDWSPRRKRFAAYVIMAVGAVIALRGVLGVLWPAAAIIGGPALTPITLAAGTVLIVSGYWLWTAARPEAEKRPATTPERASLALAAAVVLLALFWMANIFATAYGNNQAELTAATLWSKETGVIVETSQPLEAPKNMVAETVLSSDPQSPRYRYQCFRGLAVRGDRWVLVPARWTPENGYAVIVDLGPTDRVSTTRLRGIGDQPAANWNGKWQCPEVGPLG
jgi:hypothetical protein